MFNFKLFIFILFISGTHAFASNIISIQAARTASGDTGKFVIVMRNDVAVNGIHFSLRYDPEMITPIKVIPVDDAGYLAGPEAYLDDGDKIRFIVYDQGYNFIYSDSSQIFEIEYLVKDGLTGATTTDLIFTEGTGADSAITILPFEFINGEIGIDPAVGVQESPDDLPKKFALHQNYPNPFNPSTTVRFELPVESHVTLKVYNIIGQQVMSVLDEDRGAGRYEIDIDGSSMASGVYFYIIRTHGNSHRTINYTAVKKMLLLK